MIGMTLGLKGEIISCSGWRLNKLPEVRQFIKSDRANHVDTYSQLTVNFNPGKSPVLHILGDDGTIIEKIDLSEYTIDGLHEMLQQKGFVRDYPKALAEQEVSAAQ